MLFSYTVDDGSRYLDWAHRVVSSILDFKTDRFCIYWDAEYIGANKRIILRKKVGKAK